MAAWRKTISKKRFVFFLFFCKKSISIRPDIFDALYSMHKNASIDALNCTALYNDNLFYLPLHHLKAQGQVLLFWWHPLLASTPPSGHSKGGVARYR